MIHFMYDKINHSFEYDKSKKKNHQCTIEFFFWVTLKHKIDSFEKITGFRNPLMHTIRCNTLYIYKHILNVYNIY